MTVALVVPFASTDPHRLRAWDWIRDRYQRTQPDWEIVTGTTGLPWSKARAVADALTRTDADLLVIADSDCWVHETADFVTRVESGELEWAAPHHKIVRLNQEATGRVYRDGLPEQMPHRRELTERVYDGVVGGGIVIVPRDLYTRVPLDPRFVGWGGEDESWGRALLTMTSRRVRGRHPLWHCWHPTAERLNRKIGSTENAALTERYRVAAGDREATGQILEEARCHFRISSSAT